MAAEFNTGFRREEALGSAFNRHAISIQSDAINSSSEIIPMGSYFGMNTSNSTVILPGHSSMFNSSPRGILHVQAVNSSSFLFFLILLLTSSMILAWLLSGLLMNNTNWTKALASRFTDEPNIMRYIKIAAMLPDKTVRDVALRSSFMRVYPYIGRGLERGTSGVLVQLWEWGYATKLFKIHGARFSSNANLIHGISGTSRHLLEQNAQAFRKITANLSMFNVSSFKVTAPSSYIFFVMLVQAINASLYIEVIHCGYDHCVFYLPKVNPINWSDPSDLNLLSKDK
ncbi:hypothetical protein GH714_009618 [Hevea brasiliensis]|uniref:Uncharacterized protein n=1 Tax=Hevea brasiliensis TaxID=3981 RepID=A0A6A6KD06_HEVBR|nr:hypothetical protein GH714_009618 [Hevea brasiliensis]